jgi:hypothetical protein
MRSRRARRAPSSTDLVSQTPPERLEALRREHDRLLGKATLKKQQVQDVRERLLTLQRAVARRIAPLHEQLDAVSEELHLLFKELLRRGRLPRGAREEVADLYADLQRQGVLPPRAAEEPPSARGGSQGSPGGGTSARKPAAGEATGSIRDVYRRLAGAMHPDKVLDEEDKARRTEAMKELTVAYGHGDLARLLELERTWLAGEAPGRDGDDALRRCAALARVNDELRAQVKALERELRQLKRALPPDLAGDLAGAVVGGAREELARLRVLRDFVRSYQEGDISLATFLRGFELPDEQVLIDLFIQTAAPRARRARRSSGR